MALRTTRFDPADYLTDTLSQLELLKAAAESHHSGYRRTALETVARARGVVYPVRNINGTRKVLTKALMETHDPRLKVLLSAVKALGSKPSILK